MTFLIFKLVYLPIEAVGSLAWGVKDIPLPSLLPPKFGFGV